MSKFSHQIVRILRNVQTSLESTSRPILTVTEILRRILTIQTASQSQMRSQAKSLRESQR